ncbi:MAG: hypothetical protein HRT63_07685 [Erythrobacter sp.]|nr:hypothetical protein [Erythrobacter sp.]
MRHDWRFARGIGSMGGVGGALAAALIAQSAPLAAQEGQPAALEPASSAPAAQCPAAQSWRDFAGTSWPGDQIVNVIVIHEDGRISWNGGRTNETTLDRLAYLIASSDEPAITALVNRAPACEQVQKVQEIFARYGCAQGTCIVAPNLVRTEAIPPAAPAAAEAGAIESAAQDAR